MKNSKNGLIQTQKYHQEKHIIAFGKEKNKVIYQNGWKNELIYLG